MSAGSHRPGAPADRDAPGPRPVRPPGSGRAAVGGASLTAREDGVPPAPAVPRRAIRPSAPRVSAARSAVPRTAAAPSPAKARRSGARPQPEPAPLVTITGLSKAYGRQTSHVQVLSDIDLTIGYARLCVIEGASGSGKSTLLNCIGGLDEPDGGRIDVGDTCVTGLSTRDLTEYRRRQVGFVFQFYNLIPNLTVVENVQVCQRLSRDSMDAAELLESLGLAGHRDKFPAQLSGGQQQRCAVARALVKKPRLLLCDEPTGALDYQTSIDMLEVLEGINRRYGTTIIIVTHNPAIASMAHQVVRLKDGRITEMTSQARPRPARTLSW